MMESHDQMVQEFSSKIKSALTQTDAIFQNFDFVVASPQYSMNWSHGNIPDLKIKFSLQNESISVCRFDFDVDSFWVHLTENLVEKNQNSEAFRNQVHKCVKKIDEYQNGPTGQKQVAQTVSELNEIATENPELKNEA